MALSEEERRRIYEEERARLQARRNEWEQRDKERTKGCLGCLFYGWVMPFLLIPVVALGSWFYDHFGYGGAWVYGLLAVALYLRIGQRWRPDWAGFWMLPLALIPVAILGVWIFQRFGDWGALYVIAALSFAGWLVKAIERRRSR